MTPQRVLNSITELKDAEMPEKDFKSWLLKMINDLKEHSKQIAEWSK
jgi:hypothetical protein